MNIELLNRKIAEQNMSKEKLAEIIGINASTLYRKFKAEKTITVSEAIKISKALHLSKEDMSEIFFAEKLA